MDLDDDLDTHVCLRCQATIIGLDRYVTHKKQECPALKEKIQTHVTTAASCLLDNDKQSEERHLISTSENVEQNVSFTDTTTLVDNSGLGQDTFFSSLELKSNVINEKVNKDGGDNLPLGEFGFEQEKIAENESEHSDEDPFDFEKEIFSDDDVPPDSYTGGKWKPGSLLSGNKHYASTPSLPPASHTSGKWLPGKRKLDHDYVVEYQLMEAEDDRTEEPNSDCYCETCNRTLCNKYALIKHTETSYHLKMEKIKKWGNKSENSASESKDDNDCYEFGDDDKESYDCKDCSKVFVTKFSYLRHAQTEYHLKRTKHGPNKENAETNRNKQPTQNIRKSNRLRIPKRLELPDIDSSEDEEIAPYVCAPCSRTFNTRKYLAQHLLTHFHFKHAKGHATHYKLIFDNMDLIAKQSPFQCGICSFYFNHERDFLNHWTSEDHVSNIKKLTGSLFCVECEYVCNENETMFLHLSGVDHQDLVTTLNRQHPIIIKEKRTDVTCNTCNAKFHTASALKKHRDSSIHNSCNVVPKTKSKLNCNLCDYTTFSNSNLQIHIRRRHTKEKPFLCVPCNKYFCDAGSLESHTLSLRHKRHAAAKQALEDSKCDLCNITFKDMMELREHTKEVHPHSVKECGRCQAKFLLDVEYNVHVCRRSVADKKELPELIDEEALEIYACEECGYKSSSYSQVLFHQTLQHGNPEEIPVIKKVAVEDDASESNDDKQCKLQIRTVKKYRCPYCLGMFTKSALQVHINIHTGERPFKCNQCNMAFAQKSTLNMHLKRHSGCKEHKCDECEFATEKPSRLRRHKEIHSHSRPKDCLCEICGAAHHDRWTLKHHMKLHYGKAYKCPYENCEQSFRCRSELAIHIRVHTDEKPFLCDVCGYRGRSQHQLTKHSRSHTGERPFKCKYCSYSAHLSSHLQRHMRIHTGSKPYKCPYCNYTCNTQENIRKHILKTKKHSGKKVYPCRLCDFGCNSTSEYKTHLVENHKDEVNAEDLDVVSYLAGVYDRHDDKKPMEVPIPYVPRIERQKRGVPLKKKEKVKTMVKKKKLPVVMSSPKVKLEHEFEPTEAVEYVTITSTQDNDEEAKGEESLGQVVYSIQIPDKFEYADASEVDMEKSQNTILIPLDSLQNSNDSQVFIPAQFDEPSAHEDVIIPDEIPEEALLDSANTFVIYLQ